MPIRVVIAGAGGTAVSAAEIILARPNTTVTMLGRHDTPAGLLANDQFARLAANHADAELASMLGIRPGDGRFKMFLKDGISFGTPEHMPGRGGADAYKAYPGRDGRPDEFVGDAYVASAGRTAQAPPVVSDMILKSNREGGTVAYRDDFDADGQYTGYTVILKRKDGTSREVKVTGAASRFSPAAGDRSRKASRNDAPDATGTFAGGAAASSVQGSRNAARDNREVPVPENQPQ